MSDSTLMHETYRPNAAQFDGEAYIRSINSFFCPACKLGHQRPGATADTFACDKCGSGGTKLELQNSVRYARTIEARTCRICGGNIRPNPRRMRGAWWMTPSRNWAWLCAECCFCGTLDDFESEARNFTIPDHERHPTW